MPTSIISVGLTAKKKKKKKIKKKKKKNKNKKKKNQKKKKKKKTAHKGQNTQNKVTGKRYKWAGYKRFGLTANSEASDCPIMAYSSALSNKKQILLG